MSQALLQAARAGTLDKPKPTPASVQLGQQLFMTNRWTAVPRHMEGSSTEPTYLGKLPDLPRIRRRVRKRIEGKIVITYLDEVGGETSHTMTTPATQIGVTPAPRRRPPPKRKPGRGRKPGRKVKFAEEAAGMTVVAAATAVGGDAFMAPPAIGGGGEGKKPDEPVKVLEVEGGEVEVMELDSATLEDEGPKTEIDIEMERVEEKEEREAITKLQAA